MQQRILRIYLVLIFLANLGGITSFSLDVVAVMTAYPRLNTILMILLYTSGLVSQAAVIFIWRWQRLGLYLIGAAYLLMLAINLYYGAPVIHTLLGPVGLLILFLLVWPLRDRFTKDAESA